MNQDSEWRKKAFMDFGEDYIRKLEAYRSKLRLSETRIKEHFDAKVQTPNTIRPLRTP